MVQKALEDINSAHDVENNDHVEEENYRNLSSPREKLTEKCWDLISGFQFLSNKCMKRLQLSPNIDCSLEMLLLR